MYIKYKIEIEIPAIEIPEINPHIYGPLIFKKGDKTI